MKQIAISLVIFFGLALTIAHADQINCCQKCTGKPVLRFYKSEAEKSRDFVKNLLSEPDIVAVWMDSDNYESGYGDYATIIAVKKGTGCVTFERGSTDFKWCSE